MLFYHHKIYESTDYFVFLGRYFDFDFYKHLHIINIILLISPVFIILAPLLSVLLKLKDYFNGIVFLGKKEECRAGRRLVEVNKEDLFEDLEIRMSQIGVRHK